MNASEINDDLLLYLVAQDLLGRYSHGVDHGDLETALGVYWEDATDHHGGMWNGNAHDYMRDILSRFQGAREVDPPATGPGVQHHITTILVKRTGPNDALVQAGFLAYAPSLRHGDDRLGLIVGRFLDHIQCRDGVWKILARNVVNDFTDASVGETRLPSASWQEGGFAAGDFGSTDPGVAFFRGDQTTGA